MIRLFRTIRQKLLSEKSYGIYILYASGEIILVVVGILLALQIDTWSENKKTQNELTEIFDEIYEDLVLDSSSISNTLLERQLDLEAQTRVIMAIRDDLPFSDQIQSDLGRIMIRRPIALVSSGFNLLKESSLTSMEDRVLRMALIEYYEKVVLEMEEEYMDDKFEFETVLLPYVRLHFKVWEFGHQGIPVDWESLKADHYFISTLRINLNNISSTILNMQDGLKTATNIIEMLDNRK
jgi:hypothetical protein